MKKLLSVAFGLLILSTPAFGALSEASCKTKVKAAIQAEVGITVTEGSFNVLLALCKGIIEEIQQNAVVVPDTFTVTVPTHGTLPVQNTGKIQ